MQVILLERVENLGQMGDEVRVKNGYARNFLLPQKKALRATDDNRKIFEARRADIEAENLARRSEAEKVAGKLEGKTVVLLRQAGDSGQLYGSVSTRDLAEALAKDGATVNRSQIVLDKPIKALGLHAVRVALHAEVSVTIQANVARSAQEADLQASGVDVTAQLFDSEELAQKAAEKLSDKPAEEEAAEDTASEESETAESTES